MTPIMITMGGLLLVLLKWQIEESETKDKLFKAKVLNAQAKYREQRVEQIVTRQKSRFTGVPTVIIYRGDYVSKQ